jgi:hypothetical protein
MLPALGDEIFGGDPGPVHDDHHRVRGGKSAIKYLLPHLPASVHG